MPHAPPTVCVIVPQPPHLLGAWQVPLQLIVPLAHWQAPLTHCCPDGHA